MGIVLLSLLLTQELLFEWFSAKCRDKNDGDCSIAWLRYSKPFLLQITNENEMTILSNSLFFFPLFFLSTLFNLTPSQSLSNSLSHHCKLLQNLPHCLSQSSLLEQKGNCKFFFLSFLVLGNACGSVSHSFMLF